MHPWVRHGHHKHGRHHNRAGRRGPRLTHLKHMEMGPQTARGRFIRRCMSESDLPNFTTQNATAEEQMRLIVRAFFHRRHHWGRGRGCSDPENMEGVAEPGQCGSRRHHGRQRHGRKGRLSDGETDTNDEGKDIDGGNTTSERKHSRHHFRGMRHHGRHGHHFHDMWHHGHDDFRRSRCQGRDSDEKKAVEVQGKETDEANTKQRRRHCKLNHGRGGRDQGRSTSEEGSSTEDDTCRRFKKHHHWGHRHHHRGLHKGHFKRWMKHGYCPILVDASTMTQDMENVEQGPKEGESQQQVMETVEEIQDNEQGPKSPEIQEVADNLRKSSLE